MRYSRFCLSLLILIMVALPAHAIDLNELVKKVGQDVDALLKKGTPPTPPGLPPLPTPPVPVPPPPAPPVVVPVPPPPAPPVVVPVTPPPRPPVVVPVPVPPPAGIHRPRPDRDGTRYRDPIRIPSERYRDSDWGGYGDISSDYFMDSRSRIVSDSNRFDRLLDVIESRSRYDQFFSTYQIQDIVRTFRGDYAFLFAQYAYKSCRDPENYYRVVDSLYTPQDRRLLQEYLRKEGPILLEYGPSERGRFLSDRDQRDLSREMSVVSDREFSEMMASLTRFGSGRPFYYFEKTQRLLDTMARRRQGLSFAQLQDLVEIQSSDLFKYKVALAGYYLLLYPEEFESIPERIPSFQYRQRLRAFSDR